MRCSSFSSHQCAYNFWNCSNPKPWDEKQAEQYETEFARKIERWLDAGYGRCYLKDVTCRGLVEDGLTENAPDLYRLDEWVVVGNHVHALVSPNDGFALSMILQKWKGSSARQINRHLGRSGQLWQKEYYDHIVRNQNALDRIRKYMRNHNL